MVYVYTGTFAACCVVLLCWHTTPHLHAQACVHTMHITYLHMRTALCWSDLHGEPCSSPVHLAFAKSAMECVSNMGGCVCVEPPCESIA